MGKERAAYADYRSAGNLITCGIKKEDGTG